MSAPTRIFVLDDHTVIREGIRLICEETPDLEYAGGAATVDEALQMIEELEPDVVLVDLHLPGRPGTELIRELPGDGGGPHTLVLTVDADDALISEAIRGGAVGYVTKDLDPDALVRAVRKATAGDGPAPARHATRSPAGSYEVRLSPRERDVLELVARGHSNHEIGEALAIGERTVASHLASIYRKLQVPNRVMAAQYAMREGMIRTAGEEDV